MNHGMIAGSAVLPIGTYVQPEEDMIMRCVVAAARDAGVSREELRGVIAMTPRPHSLQNYQPAHVATRLGLKLDLLAEFEVSSFGINNALRLAANAILERDIPAIAIFAANRESLVPTSDFFEHRTSRTSDANFVGPYGMAPIVWNALGAREMMAAGEATEREFAEVSVRLRRNAIDNPLAYFRKPVTVDEVLASRMVAEPLRLLMVCPRTDGAGALILVREDIARRAAGRVVVHSAQGWGNDGDNVIAERARRSMFSLPASTLAVEQAFRQTGLSHADIDVVEPWVPFSPMEPMVMRGIGFARNYWEVTTVSPSGGLVARGHPTLATGFYSLHEIVQQLRGEAGTRQSPKARTAMTVSETGNFNACVVDIFQRYQR